MLQLISLLALVGAVATPSATAAQVRAPQAVISRHVLHRSRHSVRYTATVAENFVDDREGHIGAAVITVSYTRDGVTALEKRPVLFAFNGGPGASSSPLHMSALGPIGGNQAATNTVGSAELSENPDSPLDQVDLVFIDPVSTGFSRAFPGVDPTQWYSGPADAIEVATVIKNWLKVHHRESSPRYLAGESYGATRAALIVKYAPELKWNGVLLISAGEGTTEANSQDVNAVAVMAVGAWFHNKIDRNGRSVEQIFRESGEFARGRYADALAAGDNLSVEQLHSVAEQLSGFIGLPADLLEQFKLRISHNLFMLNLLKDRGLRTGLLDTRVTDTLMTNAAGGIDDPALGVIKPQANGKVPTPEAVGAVVSPTVGRYVSHDLGFSTAEPYYGVNFIANVAWDHRGKGGGPEESIAAILSRTMASDSTVRLFTISGYFDLNASDGSEYIRAGIPASRYTQLMLPGPHEVYAGDDNHKAFSDAVRRFVTDR